MDEIEKYAWRAATKLGVKMALAVKANPELFLAWYRSTVKVDA